MWTLSKQYHKTPAELLFVKDELTAYFLNRAVASFGMTIDAELNLAAQEAKTNSEAQRKTARIISRWLREPETHTGTPQFRDPAIRG